MSELKLGEIITTPQNRDAIHVAVAPVYSNQTVYPGQHIGLTLGSNEIVSNSGVKLIGIVDPYLKHPIASGDKFWMFLYPQSVTGLRHDWTHPAFVENKIAVEAPASVIESAKTISKKWMRAWATEHMGEDYYGEGKLTEQAAYERAIEAGHNNHIGPYESARDYIDSTWWDHWEAITGCTGQRGEYFSCSC